MLKLEDLMCYDDLYYIGDIIDTDGHDWVSKEEALEVLEQINK